MTTQKQLPLDALSNVVKAWESLQGQSYHSVKAVEDWLAGPMLKAINNARKALVAPVAAQPTELEELRKLVKDFPLNDRDVPIIYDTNEIDQIAYALTGDDGEDDSVTVLQRLVRALPGKTVYNLLEEVEVAAQPQQAIEPDNDKVICPNCVHQFRAIPVNVQQLLVTAGYEPPFYDRPQQAKPLSDAEILGVAEPFGAFEFGDAQGDKRLAFARAAITAFCQNNGIKEQG